MIVLLAAQHSAHTGKFYPYEKLELKATKARILQTA